MGKESITYPTRKPHFVGSSVVLTLDPTQVRSLNIDKLTFFEMRPFENGIILERMRLEHANQK